MEDRYTFLWTFENQEKMNKFIDVLKQHEIEYEIHSKMEAGKASGLSVVVYEDDYEKAKKLLIRHRKRKTSADY
jgi:hypothetical protein